MPIALYVSLLFYEKGRQAAKTPWSFSVLGHRTPAQQPLLATVQVRFVLIRPEKEHPCDLNGSLAAVRLWGTLW